MSRFDLLETSFKLAPNTGELVYTCVCKKSPSLMFDLRNVPNNLYIFNYGMVGK